MNVTHPNYGQNYQLTRAALRLRTFTVSELEDLTGALKNTVYSFVSKLRGVNEEFLDFEEVQSLRGRPRRRFTLTQAGTKYLAELSFELASRFEEDAEEPAQVLEASEAEIAPAAVMTLPSDIYEEERELVFQVDVPGLSEEDLDVSIEQNDLVVRGERPAMQVRHGSTPFMIERQRGRFVRAYPLTGVVAPKIAHVAVQNGVLEVVLRKAVAGHALVAAVSEANEGTARAERVSRAAFRQAKETAE
ncbi:Hsp20/alpha crystallin family protein [Granulicella arctica]|jgi:HSP20 family molecular chaperone IbpA|uniref:Hsp20/alpha crystallin family protein n=1 Tax=Granulicella arctica TaxID=940613 RepID=UPI0021E0975C|nr:Hsp20/alpha crystallin family protein [Granulicella arctica]